MFYELEQRNRDLPRLYKKTLHFYADDKAAQQIKPTIGQYTTYQNIIEPVFWIIALSLINSINITSVKQ